MAFSESFLQEIADKNDIVDVVGGYVQLTKRSGSNLFGLCPFHSEKTPSFAVSPDRQTYHCFGCGKGGSVINFIMEIENLPFRDAVEFLARRAGIEMPADERDEGRQRRERMLDLNRAAARFFYEQLVSPAGAPGRDYIAKRRISPEMVRRFGLGYAPDTWDSLTKAMKSRGFSEREMLDAGLVRAGKSGRGVYDTFRGRLMFPVIDVRGNVIGFSGRIIGDGEPKYMNSPETIVFSKSHNLFAMNLAKKSKNGYILLSEGNIDVVSLHQAGFDSAVASLGTSLTPEQARLISRYTGEVIIAYDNDGAGQKASQRAIGILEKLDLKVRVLQIPGAKDPDEFIKEKGADAFKNLLESTENHVEYRLQSVMRKYDMAVDEQKVDCVRECARVIAELPNPVEREVYSMRTAERAGIDRRVVAEEVERSRRMMIGKAKKQHERETMRPPRSRPGGIKYENEHSALAEEGVIRLAYMDPTLLSGQDISPEEFSSEVLARFFRVLLEKAPQGAQTGLASLAGEFTQEEMSCLTAILQKPETRTNAAQAMHDYINIIKTENNSRRAQDDLRLFAEQLRNRKGYGG